MRPLQKQGYRCITKFHMASQEGCSAELTCRLGANGGRIGPYLPEDGHPSQYTNSAQCTDKILSYILIRLRSIEIRSSCGCDTFTSLHRQHCKQCWLDVGDFYGCPPITLSVCLSVHLSHTAVSAARTAAQTEMHLSM